MANHVSGMYLKSDSVKTSKNLEDYLGEYLILFNPTPCDSKDEAADCAEVLGNYVNESNMVIYPNTQSGRIGYPAVIKGDKAYIIPSTAAFDELLGCGSLK